MTILDVDAQTLIIRKVGDVDPITGDPLEYGSASIAGVIGQSIDLLWQSHADKAEVAPRLRELYVERDAYDLVIGCLGALVDVTIEGETQRLSQRTDRLMKRQAAVVLEIGVIEKKSLTGRPPVAGAITTVAPISPPTGPVFYPWGPDANSGATTGSPYFPQRLRRF